MIAKTKIRSKKSSSGVTRSSALSCLRDSATEQAYPWASERPVLRAAAWAAALSGIPSTVHALATGRDPLAAVLAAGSVLLPGERSRPKLVAAAVPVHLALSLAWTVVFDRTGVRTARGGALAGLAVAALDLGVVGRRFRTCVRCRSARSWPTTPASAPSPDCCSVGTRS